MRIWDIPPEKLYRSHLLGEHRELHAIWSVLTNCKKGFQNPETLRWKGKLRSLYTRHQKLVKEMEKRRYKHQSSCKRIGKGKYQTGRICEFIQGTNIDTKSQKLFVWIINFQ